MTTTRKYRELNITTASPMELILMLYDECVRSLDKAEKAFETIPDPERIEVICNNLLHAQDIITELTVSLDMEKGGEIAYNLQRLYDFMVHHLSRANVNKEVQPIREVRKIMGNLREAWLEISKQEPPRPSAAAPSLAGNIRIAG
jgi:flagellar secretion chaperone FliS